MIGNQIAGFFSVGAPPVPASNFESISTVTVGAGGSASVTFSSIPATYKHLQIRYLASDSRTGTPWSDGYIRFNSDTAANYSTHVLLGDGTSAASGGGANGTYITGAVFGDASPTQNYGAGVIDILDYANTNKYKTLRSLSGNDENGSGFLAMYSGSWRSTSAINSITFTSITPNFREYSSFALYGITGA